MVTDENNSNSIEIQFDPTQLTEDIIKLIADDVIAELAASTLPEVREAQPQRIPIPIPIPGFGKSYSKGKGHSKTFSKIGF